MKNITIKNIAQLSGVSISTVSRVLNDHPDVNVETKAKIIKVIEENNFTPNANAQNLKKLSTNNIGVLVKGISNTFFAKIIATIQIQIEKKGYSVVLQQVEPNENEISKAVELVNEKKLNGVIFLGGSFTHNEDTVKLLKAPFVFVTTNLTNCNTEIFSSVYIDDIRESFRATEYLILLSHKKIAFLVSELYNNSIAELRMIGYKKALEKNFIEFDPNLVIYTESFSMEDAYTSINKALDNNISFTAIFAISDVLAIGACKAVLDKGFLVPDEISIIGFDGQDMVKYYNPSIVSLEQPVVDMAKKSVKQLFSLMNGGKHKQEIFKAKIIEGKSCKKIEL